MAAWDGPAAGAVKWAYSNARQVFERRVAESLAALLEVPSRRVVPQASTVNAQTGTATADVWLIDPQSDPSSETRPAVLVQSYLHEWFGLCSRRVGGQGAPPAPPPPPPSMPPEPPPPDERKSPPPPPGYWNPFLKQPKPQPGEAAAARARADYSAGGTGGGGGASGGDSRQSARATVETSGEPYGRQPDDWACPLAVDGALITAVDDATPPSPPTSPPPPPPPSPPSPPPSPPNVDCTYTPCEVISDEEVERLDRVRAAMGAADNSEEVLAAAAAEAAKDGEPSGDVPFSRRALDGGERRSGPTSDAADAGGEQRSLLGTALAGAPLTAIACVVWGCY